MLIWSKQFEIGIPVIDGQHRRIVNYINQIENLRNVDGDRAEIKEVLSSLVDYTLSHFEFEEALMEEADYEGLDEHQLTHDAFKNQINTLYSRFEEGEDIAAVLAEVLLNWLLQHINDDDTSYAPCVKQNILANKSVQHQNWVRQATARYFTH